MFPGEFAKTANLECPEHAPRSPAGTNDSTVLYTRAFGVPRSRQLKRGQAAVRQKKKYSGIKYHFGIYIAIDIDVFCYAVFIVGIPLSVNQGLKLSLRAAG